MPKVSIIIPCYNSYCFMGRCFEALESQSFKDFEVIIIDDCSTDNSYDGLIRYSLTSALHMTVIKNEVNCGPGVTRNVGIERSQGEWLAFCDSDDWYSIYFLEKMLEKANEKNADIVMCDNNCIYNTGTVKKCNTMNTFSDASSKNDFIAYAESSLWRLLIKRELFNSIRLPKLSNGEDIATVPQLLSKANRIAICHEALYNYLIRKDSISSVPSPNAYKDLIQAFYIIKASIGSQYPLECEYIGILTVLYGATLNAFKSDAASNELFKHILKFTQLYPEWSNNPYISKLGLAKKIYLRCMASNLYMFNKFYARLHWFLIKQVG